MIERCGCSSACSSVSRPWRRSSSTSEWSLVSRSQLAVAEQVGPAVADVGDADLVVADRRSPRSSSSPSRSATRRARRARGSSRSPSSRLRAGSASGASSPAARALERLGGDPRRDLAGLRSAHPVGDREHRRAGEQRVLVGLPLAAGVGAVCLFGDPQHRVTHSVRARTGTRCRRSGSDRGRQLRLAVELAPVQKCAVGRVHVLDVVAAPARVDAHVDPDA